MFNSILRALLVSIFIVLGATTSPALDTSTDSFNLQNSRWKMRVVPAHGAVQKTDAATSSEGQILWRFDCGG